MKNTLVSNLREVANRRPDAIALVVGDDRVSYGELWQKITNVAHYLLHNGLEKGDRVAILLNNSIEYVTSYYGVLAAGGVSVALNTATKYRDLCNWINHCGANWLIMDSAHSEVLQLYDHYKGQINILVSEKEATSETQGEWDTLEVILSIHQKVEIDDAVVCKGGDTAAIIYTSGTTGNPKGVTLTHDNLYKNTHSILQYLKLGESDSIVNVLPFYYSYGNSILHTHLASGARLVLVNNMVFPKIVLEQIQRERVTGFSGVPSTFALLLNRTNMQNFDLSSLRYITQAGGAMPPANIQKLVDILPDIDFVVMYGQTEATARLSYLPPAMLHKKMGSVGVAIPGVELEIRNKTGSKVQTDEVGEIYAFGENIMQGYWNAPDKTSEVIKDGWLSTGDLAHYDEDGYVYIVGRSSDMIKTGANRVSPNDIEEVLSGIDGVEEVAVIGVEDEIMGQVIKAFIVKAHDSNLDKRRIMVHCKENLATYKIPKYIEFIEELPKTASGKIQRFKLR